jgi:carboxypeptidase C (cathepsin A)
MFPFASSPTTAYSNHVSGEFALEQLVWSGATVFKQALPSVWLGAGSTPAGYARSSGPLTVLNVLGSGHMVPLDKPAEALDMLNRYGAR